MPFIDNLLLLLLSNILSAHEQSCQSCVGHTPSSLLFRFSAALPARLPACPSLLALCPLRLRGVVEIVGMPGGPGPPLSAAAAGQVT